MKRKKVISIVLIVLGVLGFFLKSQITRPMIIPGATPPVALLDFVLYFLPIVVVFRHSLKSYNSFALWAMIIGTVVFIAGIIVALYYNNGSHVGLNPPDQVWIIAAALNYVLDGILLLPLVTELELSMPDVK